MNKILFVCMLGYFLTLCISSMTASEKNKPQEETCFDAVIVPEQYDKTIVEQVARCIGKRGSAVICLTTVLAQLMKIAEPTISNLKNNNEWTIFTDNSERIFVLLPFGHTESSDAQKLLAKFGLINLKYVAPGNIISMIRSEKIESAWFVEQFDQLFIKNQQEHVVPRKHFFVMGHGQTNDLIAGLSIRPTKLTEFGRFLRTIESINTELIYVVSCYASGPNIITLQNELIGQAKKLFQHSSISCMVIVQATTDEITAGQFTDNIRTFFLNVNRYFIEQSRKDVPIKNRITLANVVLPLYAVSPLVINLPSVRLPGSNSFFRPIMVDKIKTITFLDIKRLLTQAIFQKRFARPGFSVGEKDILIGADIKYVLVYPAVVPTNILVSSLLVPKFISKIPGKACHIIDSLTFEGTVSREFENQQIGNLFWYPFGSDKLEIEGAEEGSKITVETYTYGESEKAWFIKTVIYYKDGKEFKLQDVIIVKYGHMPTSRPARRGELMFKKNGQYYQCFEGTNYEQAIDEQQYWTQVANILKNSMPDKNALYEATGGGQDLSSINEAIAQLLPQMERAKSIKINGLLAEMSNKVAGVADQGNAAITTFTMKLSSFIESYHGEFSKDNVAELATILKKMIQVVGEKYKWVALGFILNIYNEVVTELAKLSLALRGPSLLNELADFKQYIYRKYIEAQEAGLAGLESSNKVIANIKIFLDDLLYQLPSMTTDDEELSSVIQEKISRIIPKIIKSYFDESRRIQVPKERAKEELDRIFKSILLRLGVISNKKAAQAFTAIINKAQAGVNQLLSTY